MPRPRKDGLRSGHYDITLRDWGETKEDPACHLLYDGLVGASVLEPRRRNSPTWTTEDEEGFRSQVRGIAEDLDDRPDSLVFDPGRDNQKSVSLTQ